MSTIEELFFEICFFIFNSSIAFKHLHKLVKGLWKNNSPELILMPILAMFYSFICILIGRIETVGIIKLLDYMEGLI